MANHATSSVLVADHVYGFNGTIRRALLTCVELASGREKWSERSVMSGALTAADGKLIVLTGRGELVIAEASPAGYRELARAQVLSGKCWTVPVLSGGRIYARNAAGDVVCLDVR